MPAEWEPHDATWLAWPHDHGDWPGKFEPIPWIYAQIICNLARYERVELIVNDARAEKEIRKRLERANAPSNNISFRRWRSDRVWLRDSGCIFVTASSDRVGTTALGHQDGIKSRQLAINFRFNAWAKYSNWKHDDKIGGRMARQIPAAAGQNTAGMGDLGVQSGGEIRPMFGEKRIVLEGGSIDVNGCGTILTTEECLLSKVQQRNPGMSRKDYEKIFADYFGAPHVIWLGKGIAGDDTHGHVDDLTRFVGPKTVVTVVESNRKDPNHKPLCENLRRLRAACDQDGKLLDIIEIPLPRPVIFEKRRLPASYANFYIANGIVLVPVFNDPHDRVALNALSEVFSTRQVVPIYSGDLVWGLGTMHCMTQQQPAREM